MKYVIEDGTTGWYVQTDIDSSGMSMVLTHSKEHADSWEEKERAQWFIDNRLSERKDKRPYRVTEL